MKNGFEIKIQSDLSEVKMKIAKEFADEFISSTTNDPKFRYFGRPGGGYTTGLWRNRLGITISEDVNHDKNTENTLIFRRISKHKRIFGIVTLNHLIVNNDTPINRCFDRDISKNDDDLYSLCSCPNQRGSVKVKFKTVPDMFSYFSIGEISG